MKPFPIILVVLFTLPVPAQRHSVEETYTNAKKVCSPSSVHSVNAWFEEFLAANSGSKDALDIETIRAEYEKEDTSGSSLSRRKPWNSLSWEELQHRRDVTSDCSLLHFYAKIAGHPESEVSYVNQTIYSNANDLHESFNSEEKYRVWRYLMRKSLVEDFEHSPEAQGK